MRSAVRPFALAAVAAMLALPAVPAAAQDLAPLQDRVQRLERSINDLKAHVLGGRPLPSDSAGAAASAPPSGGDAPAAGLKVQALETEIRELTNRLEEIDFTVRRLNDRMDKLVADVDFRLTAIERNLAAGGTAPPSAGEGPAGDGSNSSAGGVAPGPRNLGTVSPEALERVPAPAENGDRGTGGNAALAAPALPVETPDAAGGTPQEVYNAAFDMLRSKRFGEAESAFSDFLASHPEHELAGNAQYWLGETYYVQQDYEGAAGAFLEGYKKYRGSSKAPDNLLKLGMTLTKLDQNKDACAVFDELRDRYPDAAQTLLRRADSERRRAGC